MPYTPMQLAEAFIQTGELQDALDALNQQLESNPVDDDARRLRIQVLMRVRDEASLRVALLDLEQLATPTQNDTYERAVVMSMLGAVDKAAEILQTIATDKLTDERFAERVFNLLLGLRRFDEANTVLSTMPKTWKWLSSAGDLATEDGRDEQATHYYSESLRLLAEEFDLDHHDFARAMQGQLLAARAQSFWKRKLYSEADRDYAHAATLISDDPDIGFLRGLVWLEWGRQAEGLAMCKAALAQTNANYQHRVREQVSLLLPNPAFAPLAALLDAPTA